MAARRRRRKKKINTSQAKNRSDHKHDYEKIIVESFLSGWNWGKVCKICGRVEQNNYNSCSDFLKSKKENEFVRTFLTADEVHEKYPQYRIFCYKREKEEGYDFKGNRFAKEKPDFAESMIEVVFKK